MPVSSSSGLHEFNHPVLIFQDEAYNLAFNLLGLVNGRRKIVIYDRIQLRNIHGEDSNTGGRR